MVLCGCGFGWVRMCHGLDVIPADRHLPENPSPPGPSSTLSGRRPGQGLGGPPAGQGRGGGGGGSGGGGGPRRPIQQRGRGSMSGLGIERSTAFFKWWGQKVNQGERATSGCQRSVSHKGAAGSVSSVTQGATALIIVTVGSGPGGAGRPVWRGSKRSRKYPHPAVMDPGGRGGEGGRTPEGPAAVACEAPGATSTSASTGPSSRFRRAGAGAGTTPSPPLSPARANPRSLERGRPPRAFHGRRRPIILKAI